MLVNGGLFANSGAVPNIILNNTNTFSTAHMLSGVVTEVGATCGNAYTIIAPDCIIPVVTGSYVFPTPIIPAYGIGTGTAQAQAAAVPIFATSYYTGLRFSAMLFVSNTGADPTMNLNGLGAVIVKNSAGGELIAGNMLVGAIADFIYDGEYFRLLNPQ